MIRENVNLADPEAVKLYVKRNSKWSNCHKNLAVFTYNEYAKMKNIQCEKGHLLGAIGLISISYSILREEWKEPKILKTL